MKILVIEDEQNIAKNIKEGLEQEKYTVDVAHDGEFGLDLAVTDDYDLIILDLLLPKIDGIQLCAQLRNQCIDTSILMLTAKGQTQDKVVGLDSGADDYLTKPFAFAELLARIRALARRPKHNLKQVLVFADLKLDSVHFTVERAGKIINLTNKEFAILEFLMRNAGRIISKEQIIRHVWEYEADILPNTIEVYVRILRNKIKTTSTKTNLIQTVRGFGYKLDS